MDKETALAFWTALEQKRHGDGQVPVFRVRLDAISARSDNSREYQARVTPGPWGATPDEWAEVFAAVCESEADIMVSIQNSGIELS